MSVVPITISGKEYSLRYTYQDFKVMETTLNIGYIRFVSPNIFLSLNAIETFLWRGLKKENQAGDYIAAFPQDEKGRDIVGHLVWSYLQEGGELSYLTNKIMDAFTTSGPFKRVTPNEPKGEDPKNSMT